ncbi:YciI family protein [Clostridioides difficile]
MSTFAYTFAPRRSDFLTTMSEAERSAFGGHVGYTDDLFAAGVILFKGAAQDGSLGIVVFEADDDTSARRIVDADPASSVTDLEIRLLPFCVAAIRSR